MYPLLLVLDKMHGMGYIHRDIKQENIFLTSKVGRVAGAPWLSVHPTTCHTCTPSHTNCSEHMLVIHMLTDAEMHSPPLLSCSQGSLRLGDFGLSINHRQQPAFMACGTLDYMAPEVMANRGARLAEEEDVTPEMLAAQGIKAYDHKVGLGESHGRGVGGSSPGYLSLWRSLLSPMIAW